MLDHDQRGPQALADPQQQRPERLGLALRDAAGGLVEEDHGRAVRDDAREVDDAARARRQLAEELGAERPEAHQLDQLVDALGDLLLGVEGVREVQRRAQRVLACLTNRSRLTASASSTVMAGNSRASWNDRPRPRLARWLGASSVMSWPARRIRPLSAGVKPEMTSKRVVLPAPFGPMIPTTSPVRHVDGRRRRPRAPAEGPREVEGLQGRLAATSPLALEPRHRCRRAFARAGPPRRRRRWPGPRPSRNTDRSRSGRSSRSAVAPEKRISPFSMKYAVSATVSATFTDCSTRMIVVPCVAQLAAGREELLDDHRRQPEGQLVDHQQARLREERHRRARASAAGRPRGWRPAPAGACRAPGTARGPARCRRAAALGVVPVQPAGHLEVLVDA